MKSQDIQGSIISDKYAVGPCIGAGAFGAVYLAYDSSQKVILALKREDDRVKNPQLLNQMKVMKTFQGIVGFPQVHHYCYQVRSNICIMDLLGPTLEDLLHICSHKFSLKTVLMLAEQILNRIQAMHAKNIVHRDIKPENFLMGINQNSSIVHIVDFGLSKKYKDPKNKQHIIYKQKKSMVGTMRYASINSQLGIQYSRRDDLEAIGYMLIYFATGRLPWQGITADNANKKYQKILELKIQTPVQTYTQNLPAQFCTYLNYCKSLKFTERPDYNFLIKLFTNLRQSLGFDNDYDYDWCRLQHRNQYTNGKMNLQIYNKKEDIRVLLRTQAIRQEQIHIQISQQAEDQPQLGLVTKAQQSDTQNNHKNSYFDSNEQNIDPGLLEDSSMKLLSTRNRWFQSMF